MPVLTIDCGTVNFGYAVMNQRIILESDVVNITATKEYKAKKDKIIYNLQKLLSDISARFDIDMVLVE